eukprot:TRINITY_DN7482_c0_g1_i1.p1 TRINITY_DN7482_c0_g1~~TRINITY_DN7482_c0_g1_i1.p1  ORF type:complete len:186 (+),score=54.26 TRINITY_DN7482_c0_g1_i1:75-632(+)
MKDPEIDHKIRQLASAASDFHPADQFDTPEKQHPIEEKDDPELKIRKWFGDFLNTDKYDFPLEAKVFDRISYNITYFLGNYIIIFFIIMFFIMILDLTLMLIMFISLVIWVAVFKRKFDPLPTVSANVKYSILLIIDWVLVGICTGFTVFTILGICFFVIFFHAFVTKEQDIYEQELKESEHEDE